MDEQKLRKENKLNIKVWIVAAFVQAMIIGLASCGDSYSKNKSHAQVSDESIKKGEQLAKIYCKSCHLLPDPSMLDAKSWQKGVLPQMGPRLGIFKDNYRNYPSARLDPEIGEKFYPSQPVISIDEWHNIIDYYTALAPDTLIASKADLAISSNLNLFKAVLPHNKIAKAKTCFVGIDTTSDEHHLLVCDVNTRDILRLNKKLDIIDSIVAPSPIVNIDLKGNEGVATSIGILVPNNGRYGSANPISIKQNGRITYDTIPLFDTLRRPVQMIACDLNNDKQTDYVVCEFGNLLGALSWEENKNGHYERHVIKPLPGAIKAEVTDYNHDGLQDIFVLFAQGDEQLVLFTNKGNGKFAERTLLHFPPYYGSTYFELADFNKDGYPDILYCCGDNADYSQILKPYHGVYIFTNDGKYNFNQEYFFHINGCFKAMARDFDNDGDLDIASISFFADYASRPEEGFVYLKNNGDQRFEESTLPEAKVGRWLTMDAGDLDGDGKIDIVLGNFSAPAMIKSKQNFENGPQYLLLKNIGH